MADQSKLGGKIGPRVADLMARAATSHLRSSADVRARIAMQSQLGVYRTISNESRTTIAPLFRELADDPELAAWLRDSLHFLGHGQGELQAIVTSLAMGTAVSPSIGTLISNELAPKIQNALTRNPHTVLDANTAAGAVARGLWSNQHGELEAARQAISANRFETLVDMSYGFPDFAVALELLRRGEIDAHTAGAWLRRQGIDPSAVNELLKLRRMHLSPANAADMVLRGIISRDHGHEIAKVAGMTGDDFDSLTLDSGEPPGAELLLFAFRRGHIDRERLEHGIRQSRIRNEWIDVVVRERFVPMSSSDAIRAAVQGHLSLEESKHVTSQNGLEPDHWQPLYETAGRPPGMHEMLGLYNRGLIGRARVVQAIRESDVKNKYIDDLIDLRRHLIPQRTLVSMIKTGVLTDREAIDKLMDLGFNHDDAAKLVESSKAGKTEVQRNLAQGTVLQLYEGHTISRHVAADALQTLGYDKQETDWILAWADLRRVRAERDHAVTVLRSRFVAHHLDDNEASGGLDAIGVPAEERDKLLRYWRLERDATTRELTEAQVIKAHKKGFLSDDEAGQRLVRMGYSPSDAGLLVAMG